MEPLSKSSRLLVRPLQLSAQTASSHPNSQNRAASHLRRFPAPLTVLGVVGEPPHVPVGLDDLGPQDVVLLVLPHRHGLQAAVELEGLGAELQHWREEEEGQA